MIIVVFNRQTPLKRKSEPRPDIPRLESYFLLMHDFFQWGFVQFAKKDHHLKKIYWLSRANTRKPI